jgi:hypothetical protein
MEGYRKEFCEIWFEVIKKNPDKEWDWVELSANPNTTWEIVKANPGKKWYQNVTRNMKAVQKVTIRKKS